MSSATVVGTVAEVIPADRREYLRLKARLPIEFGQDGTESVIRAETSDISLGGCYIEMMFTLEVGTNLQITIWADGERLRCQGVVATRHVQFGNGIRFVNLDPADRSRLQSYLESVQEESIPPFC